MEGAPTEAAQAPAGNLSTRGRPADAPELTCLPLVSQALATVHGLRALAEAPGVDCPLAARTPLPPCNQVVGEPRAGAGTGGWSMDP